MIGILEETNLKNGALSLSFTAARVNSASVMMDDEVTGHEIDPVLHRAVAANHERVKDQTQSFFRQSGTIITHQDLHFRFIRPGADYGRAGKHDFTAGGKAHQFVLEQ